MKAALENNLIKLTFQYHPRILSVVKNLPGRTYDPAGKCWYLPTLNSSRTVSELISVGFQIDPQLVDIANEDINKFNEIVELKNAQHTETFVSDLPLLPYQKVGARFLELVSSGILAFDVGLGKTITSLAAVEANRSATKVLILCPSILKWQWQAEIQKFLALAEDQVIVISGSAIQRKKLWQMESKYYIANYELLLRDFEAMDQDWDYIIADECTRIGSHASKTGKLIKKLRSKHRYALTGTLISNRPSDCWNIADWIAPGSMGNYWNFIDRYVAVDDTGRTYYKQLDDLAGRLAPIMLRRTKEECLKDLPPLIKTTIPFDLSEKEQKLYSQLKMELLFDIEHANVSKISELVTVQNTLVKMTRLRQLCDSMELLGEDKTSSKLEVLKELLPQLEGRKIIIFTEFSGMADILHRELQSYKISGSTPQDERVEILKVFSSDDSEASILVMTSAGQYGLNLQAASVIIHYDQPWSLGKLTQRTGRAHRLGQKQSVLEYSLVARKTMDDYIVRKLMTKQQISDRIMLQDIKDLLHA